MTDSEPGSVLNLDEIEKLSTTDRIRKGVFAELHGWIKTDYKNELRTLIKGEGLKRDIKLAELGRNFTRVMYIFSEDSWIREKCEKDVEKAILDKSDASSVINCLGIENSRKVEDQLLGPISVLSFYDLLINARPDLKESVKLGKVVSEGDVDVKDKVDLLLKVGSKEDGKQKAILIQLKSISEDEVYIEEIVEPKQHLRSISKSDSERILRKAKMLEMEGLNARCFAVLVPQHDTRSVGNIFGKVSNNEAGSGIIDRFTTRINEVGLI